MDFGIEKRKFKRAAATEEVVYNVSLFDLKNIKSLKDTATLIDRSAGGVRIKTNMPLEPGHVLMLSRENEHFHISVVQWARLENSHCIAGLMHV